MTWGEGDWTARDLADEEERIARLAAFLAAPSVWDRSPLAARLVEQHREADTA